MKILVISDLYPVVEGEKGIPLTIESFVLGFKKFGEDVFVYRPNLVLNVLIRNRKIYKKGLYKNKDIEIFNDNLFSLSFMPDKKTVKMLTGMKFDCIVAHMPTGVLCADKLSKILNIPVFLSVHSSDIEVMENFKYSFLKARMIKAYENASLVLPRSFWLQNKIEKIIPSLEGKTHVVPSGIKKEIIENNDTAIEKFKSYGSSKIKILAVSSLIKRKNIESLIKAVKFLNDEKPSLFNKLFKKQKKEPKRKFYLDIIGDGKERRHLEKLAENVSNISLSGSLEHKQVLQYMKESHIFILPSLKETFGMVYLEAMAKGCIVLCSIDSGISGIIRDDFNGYLIKPDIKGIKEALKKVMYLKREKASSIAMNAIDTVCALNEDAASKNYLDKIKMFNI